MSYAIAPTFEANKIGVRRAYTLGRMAGAPDALALQMISDGYDISTITTLTDANVTDAQLQNLYDHYGAGTPEFAAAANQLLTQLTGGPGGAASSPNYPQGAIPTTVSTGFGIFDLATKAGWDAAASAINTTQQLVRQAAAINPQDPTVVSNVNQFNSAVADFANYYAGAVGQPSSVSQITLSGLGDTALQNIWNYLGPSGGLLNVIYQIYLWARNYIATKQAIQQTTAQGDLAAGIAAANKSAQDSANIFFQQAAAEFAGANALPASQAAQAAAMRADAAAKQQQGNRILALPLTTTAPPPGPQPVPLTTWFENNTWIIAVLVGAAVAIPLIKKL